MPLLCGSCSKRNAKADADTSASAPEHQRAGAVAASTKCRACRGMQSLVAGEPGVVLSAGADCTQEQGKGGDDETMHEFDASSQAPPSSQHVRKEVAAPL